MIARLFALSIAVSATLPSAPTRADQLATTQRIGVMPLANSTLTDALRQGLAELGYVEGQNLLIEWGRSAITDEKLRSLAADLARAKVDVIVAVGSPQARAAQQATSTPVVFISGDPIGAGFAASLARPGGNSTGLSLVTVELNPKRLEFLQQVAPGARRIAYLMNSSNPLDAKALREAQQAARALGVQLVKLDARSTSELDVAVRGISRSTADALLASADLSLLSNKAKITQAARKAKLPAMFPWKEYHDEGALMTYGPDLKDAMRRLALYVDKILRGAKPADLPIEQISKYELVIDLHEAHAVGVDVPQALLLRADEVIQ